MSKISKSYNNDELVNALKERDEVYDAIKKEINGYDYDDDELNILNKFDRLSQFEKDLVYLSTTMSIYDVSKLYCVSPSLLYRHLREIKKVLHNE